MPKWGIFNASLFLNEHGHPSFLSQNWSYHMINIQWTKWNPEPETGNQKPGSGIHKSKKTSSSNTRKLFCIAFASKKRDQVKKTSNLTFFETKISRLLRFVQPLFLVRAVIMRILTTCVVMIPGNLRASKISLLVIAILFNKWSQIYRRYKFSLYV